MEEIFIVRLISAIPACFIVMINMLLAVVITFFSRFEKHKTSTDYNTSRAYKLTVMMFINTALIAPIVYRDHLYGSDALIAEVYNIVLANAILSPLF
jgi:uncharacterized membrane protein (DUF4010 family)